MPQTRPSAGDYSGKIKADANKEALQEQRDRTAEMSLATAVENEEKQDGVFSPYSQERIDVPAPVVVEVEEQVSPFGTPEEKKPSFYDPERPAEEPVFTGYETDEQMTPYLSSRHEQTIPQAIVRSPMAKIRVSQDIDDMTYGFNQATGNPNNLTFKEGFVYEVDINVAEHLNQRGLVAQWVG